jgi:hypothetical protein
MAQKDRVYSPLRSLNSSCSSSMNLTVDMKTPSFLGELSLCLSRACLGKMMHFYYKMAVLYLAV